MRVYADNAATTKISRAALQAMMPYFEDIYGNPSSLHTPGQESARALYLARAAIADVLGVTPSEIYFTSCGSESDNQAIFSAAAVGAKLGKRHIVSTAIEHHAVLNTLDFLKSAGFEITLIKPRGNGIVCVEDIRRAIQHDTALVSVMYANNETGAIQPIAEIGEICRANNIVFHTDAVQAVGHTDVNVVRDNIDMMSFSAHKFHGPKGAGVLYVKNGIPVSSFIHGGRQERGKRAGTENLPAIVGMAAALKEAVSSTSVQKIIRLRDKITNGLMKISGAIFNGDTENRLPGIVNVSFSGVEGEALLLMLNEKGVYASSGAACTSGSLDASHVLLAMGRSKDEARGSLRISLSAENTDEEADYIIKTVSDAVLGFRNNKT